MAAGKRATPCPGVDEGRRALYRFRLPPDDILLFGRESAGVPETVHDKADARVIIPMVEGQRLINVAMSAAMIAGEALRQTA